MPRRAIVAGAGIAGLASAIALQRADCEVTIYERSAALEEFGAGLQLTPNATRILERLDVLGDIRRVATAPRAVRIASGRDDSPIANLALDAAEKRWGAPYLVVHRADLQRALCEAAMRIPQIALVLGAEICDLTASDESVEVVVKRRGETLGDHGDLAIGADGLRSVVRRQLAFARRDELQFTGRVAFRATIEAGAVAARFSEPDVVLELGPGAHLVHYPLRNGAVVNVVAVIESLWRDEQGDHPWDGDADRAALERAFAGWSRQTRGLIAATTNWRAWPLYVRRPLTTYSRGRVALVGDAAHPMVPFLAQGAAQGIEDAGALGRRLSQAGFGAPQALAAYSRDRVARATRVQSEASSQGRIYHLSGPMALARDTAMRLMGPKWLGARYDWLYGA